MVRICIDIRKEGNAANINIANDNTIANDCEKEVGEHMKLGIMELAKAYQAMCNVPDKKKDK